MKKLSLILAAALFMAGCLVKETTHVLYIEPDGSVTWTVREENIRSDSTDAESRRSEEESFMASAQEGDHPVARALRGLTGAEVRTTILRSTRPAAVFTSARLGPIDAVAREILGKAGIPAEVEFESDGDIRRLTITNYPALISEEEEDPEPDSDPVFELVGWQAGHDRIRLAEGKFLEARGFEIIEEGAAVIPAGVPEEEALDEEAPVTFALAWTVRP